LKSIKFGDGTLPFGGSREARSAPSAFERLVAWALRTLRRENPESRFVFVTERGGPMSTSGFLKMIGEMGELAKLGSLKVHPHMLRHSCGYKLGNAHVDTRTIQD
jgi:site-specific recombinase XerD